MPAADGKTLVAASGGTKFNPVREFGHVTTWDLTKGKELRKIELPKYVGSLSVSKDGVLAACGSGSDQVRIVNLTTGKEEKVLGTPKDQGRGGVAFTPDGKLLLAGIEFKVKVWDVASGEEKDAFVPGPGNRVIKEVAVSPQGKVVAAASVGFTAPDEEKHRIHFWDLASGKLLGTCKGHTGELVGIAFSADGKLLASAGRDKTLRLWKVPTE